MQDNKTLSNIKAKLHQQLPMLSERYKIKSLALFGSYVHRDPKPTSDLDLLVTYTELPSLLKFIELENYLTDFLGIKVDLVMKDALKPNLGERILSEAEPV